MRIAIGWGMVIGIFGTPTVLLLAAIAAGSGEEGTFVPNASGPSGTVDSSETSFILIYAAACAVIGLASVIAFVVTRRVDMAAGVEPMHLFSTIGSRTSEHELDSAERRVTVLRVRATQEVVGLRPEPADPHEHATWVEERRAAAVLLSALADHDGELLRRAATGEQVSRAAHDLLLDAAEQRG